MIPYVCAGVVAAVLSAIELRSRIPQWPRRTALLWVILRLAVDSIAAASVMAVLLGNLDPSLSPLVSGPVGWVSAGTAGPALLRLRIVTLSAGDRQVLIGPAAFFEPLIDYLDRHIADAAAIEQMMWLALDVWPLVEGLAPRQLADQIRDYADAARLDSGVRRESEAMVRRVLQDARASDEEKSRLLLYEASRLGGTRLVERLVDWKARPGAKH